MEIYETVFEFEPDIIEAKKQELLRTRAQTGLYLGQEGAKQREAMRLQATNMPLISLIKM